MADAADKDHALDTGGVSRLVVLDSVHTEDLPKLLRWMNDIDDFAMWTTRRKQLPYEDLAKHILERCRSGLYTVIRNRETGEPLGFIDGTLREQHGVAEIEVYISKEWRLHGALVGAGEMLRHLFASYPLRKIYVQAYAYNTAMIGVLHAAGFTEEGCFKEFIWWKDRYWDMYVYSVDRQAYEAAERGEGRLGRLRQLGRRQLEKRTGHDGNAPAAPR